MTYNITEKKLVKTKEEVNVLKEMNGQQKQEINRLKDELKMKDYEKGYVSKESDSDV